MKRFLSLGAGVQSSTLLLMIAHGELPMIDAAIFADTGDEPPDVYNWLDWLEAEMPRCPFPVPIVRVSCGEKLSDRALRLRVSKKTGNVYLQSLIPAYFESPRADGSIGRGLMGRRCTAEFKVRVLRKAQRQIARVPRGCKSRMCEVLIGISYDEYLRMKPSEDPWAVNSHPLVDRGITRDDCYAWMDAKGYPRPPRSACEQCPFHGDDHWSFMKREQPESFARAVRFDYALREAARKQTGSAKLSGDVYLHSSLKPLDQIDFDAAPVPPHAQLSLFNNECEGMCGV